MLTESFPLRLLSVFRAALAGVLLALAVPARANAGATSPVLPTPAAPASKLLHSSQPRPGHYVVVLHEEVSAEGGFQPLSPEGVEATASSLASSYGASVGFVYTHALRGFSAEMSEEVATAMSEDAAVAFVEEDSVFEGSVTQSGPPWGLDRLDQRDRPLDSAYRYGRTGDGVNDYVIDSGIWYSHQEFQGRAFPLFDAFGGNAWDGFGHGTHVAGIIGGATVGVAKRVSLYGVRVLGCDNQGTTESVVAGVDFVTRYDVNYHGGEPSVVNMSLGGPPSARRAGPPPRSPRRCSGPPSGPSS